MKLLLVRKHFFVLIQYKVSPNLVILGTKKTEIIEKKKKNVNFNNANATN